MFENVNFCELLFLNSHILFQNQDFLHLFQLFSMSEWPQRNLLTHLSSAIESQEHSSQFLLPITNHSIGLNVNKPLSPTVDAGIRNFHIDHTLLMYYLNRIAYCNLLSSRGARRKVATSSSKRCFNKKFGDGKWFED